MAEPEQPLPPAGWYDDPEGAPGRKRYWDGQAWTDRFEGSTATASRVAAIDREFSSLHRIATIFHVLGWLTLTVGTLVVIAATISAADTEEVATTFGDRVVTDSGENAAAIAIVGMLGVLLYSLLLFAASAFTRLWLRMEDNTFRTAAALERMAERER